MALSFTLCLVEGSYLWLLCHTCRKVAVLVCPSCLKSALCRQKGVSSPCQAVFIFALSFVFLIE